MIEPNQNKVRDLRLQFAFILIQASVSIESVPWCSMGRGGDFRASHVQDDAVLVAVEGDVDELTGGAPSSDDPAADRERVTIAVTQIRR